MYPCLAIFWPFWPILSHFGTLLSQYLIWCGMVWYGVVLNCIMVLWYLVIIRFVCMPWSLNRRGRSYNVVHLILVIQLVPVSSILYVGPYGPFTWTSHVDPPGALYFSKLSTVIPFIHTLIYVMHFLYVNLQVVLSFE